MTAKIVAPFTPQQVEALNRYQRHGRFHPFTCGNDRGDVAHRAVARQRGEHDLGLLEATPEGWRCPACRYRQNWAHAFMAEPVMEMPG